jgi:hypothetical protein
LYIYAGGDRGETLDMSVTGEILREIALGAHAAYGEAEEEWSKPKESAGDAKETSVWWEGEEVLTLLALLVQKCTF